MKKQNKNILYHKGFYDNEHPISLSLGSVKEKEVAKALPDAQEEFYDEGAYVQLEQGKAGSMSTYIDEGEYRLLEPADEPRSQQKSAWKHEEYSHQENFQKGLSQQEELGQNDDNDYSDVFEVEDSSLFDDVETFTASISESKQNVEDETDLFARDLQDVMSGKKSLTELAGKQKQTVAKPNREAEILKNSDEDEENKEVSPFDKLSQEKQNVTTYQLGEVELENLFEQFEQKEGKSGLQKARAGIAEEMFEEDLGLSDLDMVEDFDFIEEKTEKQIEHEEQKEEEKIENNVRTEVSKPDSEEV